MRRLRRRVRKQPGRIIAAYKARMRDKWGVTSDRQVWQWKDYTRRLQSTFGRMRGLWRVTHALTELHQLQVGQKTDEASAFTVMLIRD